ncbi:urocanate hydratase [Hymenobacter sp. BT635]|uniref:Urocanate hydratase n=1 Tax=Hymenobacter nitidus TaxID=2880929 RepID=A0ABS8AFF5_9BACT|nr:urocanate hydratase [Hymenobacter nitidus]MCB2378991.1 urocanate hydratase [Hymenobacter nitidus]
MSQHPAATDTPELNLEANSHSDHTPAPVMPIPNTPSNGRPMYYEYKPEQTVKAQHGTTLRCKTWEAEAALRMLENNLDPAVSLVYDELIVYGGAGRAARNWKEYQTIVRTLKNLEPDETMLVQSGKAVGVLRTWAHAPRVLIANSNIVPAWSTQEYFDELDKLGLMMYGQMTAGSWIYIATQGILQGTYETFAAVGDKHFGGSLAGTVTVTAGLGGMSGAQPLAVTMNDGVCLVIEPIDERVKQKVREGYLDEQARDLSHALELCEQYKAERKGWSIGLTGNAATVLPELLHLGYKVDIVTDQTSAHDLMDYIPEGDIQEVLKLRAQNPEEFKRQALASIVKHCQAIIDMQAAGAVALDYGNNLRGQAEKGGLKVRDDNGQFLYPGFVPGYIRPLFCEGKGPFRWCALSGDPQDILRIDRALLETFPDNKMLARWIEKAQAKVPFIGLPARVCWLGYGEREKFGLVINDLVARGEVSAPIVIGRDHLDCGSVASPNRETEGMKDGSDAVADWPLLNALANCASGADWVSLHNGGGVGIGNSTHSGMVIVATGTPEKAERLRRVLTTDPGMGVFRHADAGYELAQQVAQERGVQIPGRE